MAARTPPPGGQLPYKNPFRSARVTPQRIDQGVDYTAAPGSPVYALGPGVVDQVYNGGSGWPGGGWVSYVLSDGPAKGQRVFVAEDITPTVRVGQHVTSDTIVGRFKSGSSIETGYAGPRRFGDQTLAAYRDEWNTSGDPGRWSTVAGVDFSNLLAETGAPPGILTPGGIRGPGQKIVKVPVTQVTSGGTVSGGSASSSGGTTSGDGGLGGFFSSVWAGLQAGLGVSSAAGSPTANAVIGAEDAAGSVSDVAQAIATLSLPFTVFANALDWFFVPSHWVRIASGIGGGILVTLGLINLSGISGDVVSSLPGGSALKPAALPVGIAEVGFGAVLLFIAFHNLDPSIKTVGDLLADLQAKGQASLQAGQGTSQAVAA